MLSLAYIDDQTPMGASLKADGATFKVWAPRAHAVYVTGDFNGWGRGNDSRLFGIGGGYWAGFHPGAKRGHTYKFYVVGPGGEGYKRDPYARELTADPPFPFCNCVISDPNRFPWHDQGYRPPAFQDFIVYQFHVGTFSVATDNFAGKFLDVIEKLPYLQALGVNAIQPLPIVEFPTEFSLGYNGTDYFSPEEDYGISDHPALEAYLNRINGLLDARQLPLYEIDDIACTSDQFRALVDVCHVYGIAVLLDVVYNHAGGGFDKESLYFFDQMPRGDNNDSQYFTDRGWAGGLVFAYWNADVRQLLIDNALSFIREYHVDGFRYDEVSVIDRYGGWFFCRDLTEACRPLKPSAIHIAEYWPVNKAIVQRTDEGGAGFDATLHDGLRDSVRNAIAAAARGGEAAVDLAQVAGYLRDSGLSMRWKAVQCIENHDIVKKGEQARVARLADGSDARSWYARSRARVANGLLMTAPGIPLLFMGQEMLEDKQWSDDPESGLLLWWAGLEGADKAMADHLRFMQDLTWLRRRRPSLRSSAINVFHVHNANRVMAYHRWVEGAGHDVVVVASLNDTTFPSYDVGFPGTGSWLEIFNSDVYDHWVNPWVSGNGGVVHAGGSPLHGLPASATVTIPANGLLVFARE